MNKNDLSPMPSNIKPFGKTKFILCLFGLLFLLLIVFLLADVSRQRQVVKREDPNKRLGRVKQERWYSEERFNLGNYLFDSGNKDEATPNLDLHPKDESNDTQEVEDFDQNKEFLDAIKAPGKISVVNTTDPSSQPSRQQHVEDHSSASVKEMPRQFDFGYFGDQAWQLQKRLGLQERKEQFLRSNVLPGDYLAYPKDPPISRYELKAGTQIPAILEQGINSDLPGDVSARVRANVYDSVTGNQVLIPQGASLIGRYDSAVDFGKNRVLVIWSRLIFPDGASLNLEKMPGVDIAGYAGFKDKVKHHRLQIYGNAVLLSVVGSGYELLVRDTDEDDAEDVVARSIGQQLADVFAQVTRRNLDRQPTIQIRPGYRFNVLLVKDIILEDFDE